MPQRAQPHSVLQLAAVCIVLAIGLGLAGYFYYASQKEEIERSKQEELSAIAGLKVNQISGWRKERVEDALVTGNNPMLARAVDRLLTSGAESAEAGDVFTWMQYLKEHHDYGSVLLADAEGAIRLSTDPGEVIETELQGYFSQVVSLKTPMLSELYRSETDGSIRLCLFVPILEPRNPGAPLVGLFLFKIDPHRFLYPLIQSWPTQSRSSESLLIRREGNDILFLNELRHRSGTALSLRRPMDGKLPAARALMGEQGVMEGEDYRGIPVLASILPVPDTPWFFIAKVDMEEVYRPVRERAGLTAVVVAMMIFGATAGLAFIWTHHQREAMRKARDELERRVTERTAELAKANEALQLEESRLEALWELSQMSSASSMDIMDFALEQQVSLTMSKIGAIGFMNEEETVLTLFRWSQGVAEQCRTQEGPTLRFPVDAAGIWAEAVRKRRPIIINDYSAPDPHKKGYPAGHLPINRFMSVPVLDADRIVAVSIVANKDEDYNASDAQQLTLLMDGMWKLVQRQRAEKALRETESLAAMGRALSSVAHDMKTPLMAIGGFSQMVLKHLEESNPDRAKLDIVVRETERLERMVKDMLDFSRPLELERTATDINRVVEESVLVVDAVALERKVKLHTEPARDLPPILLDSMRMKQVVINLVMNAVQASPEGQEVKISTHRRQAETLVDVTDCGCGIPSDKREEIFQPFVSTKKEGTGLGLAIVRKIVEAHRGRVEILENSETGVTFRVVLPGP